MKKRTIQMAPWRLEYLERGGPLSTCFICDALKHEPSPENLVLVKTGVSAVMLNRYPYNNGHLMIVPIRHISRLNDLSASDLMEIGCWMKTTESILQTVYKPQGFNIGINIGSAAGAGLDSHIHIHMLPRWSGDTNFMTTIGDARIIPEHLDSTWHRLATLFQKERDSFQT